MRQTPASEFRRLEGLLEDEGAVQWLAAFDDAIWQQLKRGELVAVESNVAVPTVLRLSDLAEGIGPIMGLAQLAGEVVDEGTREAIEGITKFGQALREVPVVARPTGAAKYKFIVPLRRDALAVDLGDLHGESVVIGSIQRRLKHGESYSLLDNLGMSAAMSRTERRQAERDMRKNEAMRDAVISGPAAILTPLAVYR